MTETRAAPSVAARRRGGGADRAAGSATEQGSSTELLPRDRRRRRSYTSFRLGLYKPLKVAFGADKDDSPFILKFLAGGASGGLGSIVGNPFDILKTKMMASETGLSLGGTASAIYANQGIMGFYKGIDANVMRAVVNNGTKMACYDQSKQLIHTMAPAPLNSGVPLQALASFVAGFFMTCTVAPFDICPGRGADVERAFEMPYLGAEHP